MINTLISSKVHVCRLGTLLDTCTCMYTKGVDYIHVHDTVGVLFIRPHNMYTLPHALHKQGYDTTEIQELHSANRFNYKGFTGDAYIGTFLT